MKSSFVKPKVVSIPMCVPRLPTIVLLHVNSSNGINLNSSNPVGV